MIWRIIDCSSWSGMRRSYISSVSSEQVSRGDDGPPLLIVDSPTAAQFGGSVTMLVMKVPSDGIDLCSQNLIFFSRPAVALQVEVYRDEGWILQSGFQDKIPQINDLE